MSDSMEDLSKKYDDEVLFDYGSLTAGPFPIPEYPTLVFDHGMWSTALNVIFTTLRYLAPATLLSLFWGQQSLVFRLLKHVDTAFRAITYSSEEQKRDVLKWISEAGSARIEHLDTIWRHGWILCGILDAALPGACAGHPPTRLSLKHAQAIADHYLGVEPVFSRIELESSASLSKQQEWKLATYLNRIRQALEKLTPAVSKPTSQRTSPEAAQFTLDYVARGSGLSAAQINNKMRFKIYPTAQQCLDPGEITVLIKGPKDTYGMTQIPPILGKAQLIRQKLLGLQVTPNYTENVLPLTQGATYLRAYGKNKMTKTYFIPKVSYDVEIEFETFEDHAKIEYTVKIEGKYEISITSRGINILGSPFQVSASQKRVGLFEKESFCLDDGDEIDIVNVPTDRKVVLRIVDFVTEKMLLTEDGTLEKISEDEAQKLMKTDQETVRKFSNKFITEEYTSIENSFLIQERKFKNAATKVKNLIKICRIFNNFLVTSNIPKKEMLNYIRPKSPQDIPDIVNSTFSESNKNPFVKETRNKFIVPESISVSIRNEVNDENDKQFCKFENLHLSESDVVLRQIVDDSAKHIEANNPFVNTFIKENDVFVSSEYEADYSQNEEEPEAPIKIVVDEENSDTSLFDNYPCVPEEFVNLERPKTPVLKIITGNVKDREDSLYVDPKIAQTFNDDILGNEFINPFFMHQHHHTKPEGKSQATDFLIGAPVSLPPILRASTPEPTLDSIMLTANENFTSDINAINVGDDSPSVFSTPLHTYLNKKKDNFVSSTFHSLDSDSNENVELYDEAAVFATEQSKNVSSRKDLWDSAYVSIDDVASSPDSNNNDNISSRESPSKCSFSPSNTITIKNEELTKMGPAEKEIWRSCNELKNITLIPGDIPLKIQDKRLLFTPIQEDSDRSLSMGKNETPPKHDIDSVTAAFAEINDIYHKYYPKSENKSKIGDINIHKDIKTVNKDDVDSASEIITDVKRQTKIFEGAISEIQPLVTESFSVSRTLRAPDSSKAVFEDTQSNIVLEKKLYWDKRIKEIEAKAAENSAQQKRRRLSAKYLRNDSLTKRRGKQIVKTILNKDIQKPFIVDRLDESKKVPEVDKIEFEIGLTGKTEDAEPSDEKLVEKWKKYWDDKLETEKDLEVTCSKARSPKNKSPSPTKEYLSEGKISTCSSASSSPVKQELPEEVFKAFETSPKRFFGTSRKQILNKIDNFLGKPSIVDKSTITVSNGSKETGLVSSRISLFHNISHTESPNTEWTQRKSQSMHNIFQKKPSDAVSTQLQKSQPSTPEPVTKSLSNTVKETESGQSVKEKRAKFAQCTTFSRTFDEQLQEPNQRHKNPALQYSRTPISSYTAKNVLQKTSISKSELDLFSKRNTVTTRDYLDRYQSCDDLPKVNVKNFISLYETVSKSSIESKPRKMSCSSIGSNKNLLSSSSFSEPLKTFRNPQFSVSTTSRYDSESPKTEDDEASLTATNPFDNDLKQDNDSGIQIQNSNTDDDRHSYISLSDMEIEIIENSSPEKSLESTPERETEAAHIEYKSRFKSAKDFFKSLEEIRDDKKLKKLNECEKMLYNTSTEESLEEAVRPPRRVKKNIKSNSVPSSEIANIWNQLQENKTESKLVKISEKFNLEDLFSDVVEGKLSRQGSLRGIPNKKAVLETFKSMDNLTDKNLSAYEIVVSQLKDFTMDNKVQNAQTYLSEYPYLPKTDPSKYHSRIDAKASGLISLKELLEKKYQERNSKPRRNSVPDLRLNPTFTVEL